MKNFLLFFLLFAQAGYAQNKNIPSIDVRAVRVKDLLWDLKALSNPPEVEWISQTGTVHTLLYKSVDYEGKPTQVFAYYTNPDLLLGMENSKRKFPGVVLLHGGGGKAFKEWAEKWAADGYAAIAMDLSGNDADGKKLVLAGADQQDDNKFQKIEKGNLKNVWTYHAVASAILAHSLLLNLPEVDDSKTCLTGISWGGYLTCIVASLDNRFKAAAPVYGCGYYDESDIFKVPVNQLSIANKQKWMKYFDPSSYMAFAKPSFLFVNGNTDPFYNVVPYHKTYRLIDKSRRTICIKPAMMHSHEHGWEPAEIKVFFENVVNSGKPLIKVIAVADDKKEIKLTYRSPSDLSLAEWYYTNDDVAENAKRNWRMQPAVINPDKKTITVVKPPQGYKYAFFYLKDQRNAAVSSAFMFN